MFFCLLDGVTVDFHLPGEIFPEHSLLVDPVEDESYGGLCLHLDRRLSVLGVIEPSLDPPAQSGLVGIDGDQPRNVETLYVDFEILKRVNYSGCRDSPVIAFFLLAKSIEDRNML